jgi:hypothetical protein
MHALHAPPLQRTCMHSLPLLHSLSAPPACALCPCAPALLPLLQRLHGLRTVALPPGSA